MREFARVVEEPTLVRDVKTNAVLSNDRAAFERRKQMKKDKEFKNSLLNKIDALEERIRKLEERLAKYDG
ncbi:hypothetical protein AU106_gp130 [Sinorhizobium phage phiM9]|uniref:Uncharacterized protein n=1 Tax=Sinorhizobium phage phiM9 TaxID=1636182 RepID=A0A0F6TGN4_9CAUD|nr:hypothetical protein AU106_gp130 [Sinorhizobium phage phiM9]AKE44761.1 hypothetical protein Sm_phiM9_133 [Sinorhizobium phage phiM9]